MKNVGQACVKDAGLSDEGRGTEYMVHASRSGKTATRTANRGHISQPRQACTCAVSNLSQIAPIYAGHMQIRADHRPQTRGFARAKRSRPVALAGTDLCTLDRHLPAAAKISG